ncbi:MAG TPA: gliding motility-associated C-terminal domain-containing protein [Puia sp.]|jgi:gliding motility-associated-like protein
MKPLIPIVLFLLMTFSSWSQICSSGHGDAIVNITFGAGTGIGPELAPGVTNMQYVTSECVGDNVYTITNEVRNCYVGEWHTLTQDHTGDPNGYFMLIGASFQPSTFYTQTVSGLCGSTQYQFSVWVLNMASHGGEGLPNFTFSIQSTSGTPIQSFTTGDVPWHNPAQWDQYTFAFTTPPGVNSVVLQMTNNAPGGYGNDLCLDDITFRTLGPAVNISVDGHSSDTVTICNNDDLNFTSVVSNSCYASTAYQWQESTDNGANWTTLSGESGSSYSSSFTTAGAYLYRMVAAATGNIGNPSCQVVSSPDSILVLDPQVSAVSITGPSGVCSGSPASFNATPVNGGADPQYQWMVNGAPAGVTTAVFNDNTVSDGDQISCVLTSDAACVPVPVVTSNTLPIVVSLPIASSVSISASDNNICANKPVTFTAMPMNGGAAPSYQWIINGTTYGSTTAAFTDNTPADGDEVSCIMESDAACPINTTASSNTILMAVIPNVTTAVDIVASSDPICGDKPVTFTAIPTNGGTAPVFQWLVNGTTTGTTDAAYTNNNPAGGDEVSCIMTSNATCPVNVNATSATLTVTNAVIASLTISATANPVCSNSPATYTAVSAGGGANPLFQWMVNGAPAGSTSDVFNYNNVFDGDQISCVLTSDAVCVTDPIVTSNTVQMSVIPNVYPSLDITASTNPVCSGSPVSFSAQPSTNDYDPSFRWMVNGAVVGDSTATYYTGGVKDGDVISAIMTNRQQCSNPASSNIISMTVYPKPVVSLPPDTIIHAHSTIQMLPVVSDATLSYQWSDNISFEERNFPNPYVSPLNTTTYNLVVTSSSGCESSTKELVEVFYDLNMPNAFTPNGDGTNDIFRVPPVNPVMIRNMVVFNRWGGVVFSANGDAGWDGRFKGKPQPTGTYVWEIEYFDPFIKQVVMRKGFVELIR